MYPSHPPILSSLFVFLRYSSLYLFYFFKLLPVSSTYLVLRYVPYRDGREGARVEWSGNNAGRAERKFYLKECIVIRKKEETVKVRKYI